MSNSKKFWLSAVIVTLVAVVLYWPTLSLPLMFDDLLHIRLAKKVTYATVWLPSTDFGFYRPFVFLPFLIIKDLFGHFPAPLLHALNIFQHALNAFLLTWLIWRLWGKWQRALVAGLILATYPFAYQAVAMYGNNIYPTSASIILGLLHFYLSFQQTKNNRWLIAMLVLFVYGLLSHETIILFGPLALLLHFASADKPALSLKTYWAGILFSVLGAVYIVVYQFLPTGGGPTDDFGTTALMPKLLYLVQTAVYPIAWFSSLSDTLTEPFVYLGLIILLTLTVWGIRQGLWRELTFGWGWWLLASAVIGLNLPTYYILHGARLVYLGGLGAALIWAILLGALTERTKFGQPIYWLSLLFIVATSSIFVRDRLSEFHKIAEPVRVMQQTLKDVPTNESVTLINLPTWTAPEKTTYPIGVEYVTLMGFHLFAEELISQNLAEEEREIFATTAPDLLASPSYAYGIHDQVGEKGERLTADWSSTPTHIFISRYPEKGLQTTYTGQFAPYKNQTPIASFGGYNLLSASATQCGSTVTATFNWHISDPTQIPSTASIFAQLLNQDGFLIAQADGAPLGLNPASYDLPQDWQINEHRQLITNNEIGKTILVGSYDFNTGERFPATDTQNNPLQDNAFSLPIQSCP